ncbi:MAG: hypothetical protein Q4B17_10340 [Lautropia sp.]|nr:hypothetical protein [Lautropia sp.]
MKYVAAIIFSMLSVSVQAGDVSIYKEGKPTSVFILDGTGKGSGTSRFYLISTDFPRGTLSKMKTLKSIYWKTTYYPNNTGEKVRLCYIRPYSTREEGCVSISPNSSGSVTNFNNYKFGNGAGVNIRHEVTGGDKFGRPAGKNFIIFNYYEH